MVSFNGLGIAEGYPFFVCALWDINHRDYGERNHSVHRDFVMNKNISN